MNNGGNGKRRTSLRQWFKETYDRVTLHSCRGEYLGCRRLLLQGCREILAYGKEKIVFAVEDPDVGSITVEGSDLLCLTYHTDAVTVCGIITAIRFDNDTGG